MRQKKFSVSMDKAFRKIISACATIDSRGENGTWITDEMIEAYCQLHHMGFAHSVECWLDDELAGGLYGISLGGVFFGESMFSNQTNGSKVALVSLVNKLLEWDFDENRTPHAVWCAGNSRLSIPEAAGKKLVTPY